MRFETAFVRAPRPSFSSAGRHFRIPALLLVLFAACIAAVLAHVVIDLLGDVLLVRDAYDYEAHASRSIALDAALFGGVAVAWYIVANALAEARGGKHCLRAAARSIVAGSACHFIGRVIVATVLVLAFMGALDARLDAVPIDDVADLFGGSSALGLSVCIALGGSVGFGMFGCMRWIAVSHRTIVAAVIALISLVRRTRSLLAEPHPQDRVYSSRSSLSALARRAGKRAPPLLLV